MCMDGVHHIDGQTYEKLQPLLVMRNITVRNRMVPNTISDVVQSLNGQRFFVSLWEKKKTKKKPSSLYTDYYNTCILILCV